MSSQAFTTLPPTDNLMQMLNAIRVAAVNLNYPGSITYDPFSIIVPQSINTMQMLNAIRLALEGEVQS